MLGNSKTYCAQTAVKHGSLMVIYHGRNRKKSPSKQIQGYDMKHEILGISFRDLEFMTIIKISLNKKRVSNLSGAAKIFIATH